MTDEREARAVSNLYYTPVKRGGQYGALVPLGEEPDRIEGEPLCR
jgi:hypothetical protein